jgi:hypothetical protein
MLQAGEPQDRHFVCVIGVSQTRPFCFFIIITGADDTGMLVQDPDDDDDVATE